MERQIVNANGSPDDSNAGAMTALLAILVIAVIAFGIWFTSRSTVSAIPGTPNTGVTEQNGVTAPTVQNSNNTGGASSSTPTP